MIWPSTYASKCISIPAYHHRSTATRNAGTIILKVTYGYTAQEEKDPFVELADKVMHVISLTVDPGAFLVDIVPACMRNLNALCCQIHTQVTCSKAPPGMVPWYGLPARSKEIPSVRKRVGSKASQVCHGANGKIVITFTLTHSISSRARRRAQ